MVIQAEQYFPPRIAQAGPVERDPIRVDRVIRQRRLHQLLADELVHQRARHQRGQSFGSPATIHGGKFVGGVGPVRGVHLPRDAFEIQAQRRSMLEMECSRFQTGNLIENFDQ